LLLKLIKSALKRNADTAALHRLAIEHHGRGELAKAEDYFREVALRTPLELSAWTNLAATLLKQQKYAAAIPILLQIIDLSPELAEAHLDLGVCYNRLKQNEAAIRCYQQAITLEPRLDKAYVNIVNAYLDCCDWKAVDLWTEEFLTYRGRQPSNAWMERLEPFCALTLFPGTLSKESAIYHAKKISQSVNRKVGVWSSSRSETNTGKRIRIGYVTADFRNHPTAHLTFRLYQAHSRREFEIFAYSIGPDDGSDYRKNIEKTCDHFFDARYETAERTAERIRSHQIDILVDMNCHGANSRPRIFALRPAPVQVNYLGYPGTSGAEYIDYFISDRVATPPGYEEEFTERIVYLPGSYFINDKHQPFATQAFSRPDFHLPQNSFVFCCFNRVRKIDRQVFSAWMEILRSVPDGVLWLITEDPLARGNLRREAVLSGVDPERLIFGQNVDKPVHLARHRLADLFLDTLTYNAHSVASDSLLAGLPVLTCPGKTFMSRVAASLLAAASVPELIVKDLDEYKNLAVRLARDREELNKFRRKLEQGRLTCSLFDADRYARNLEHAYRRMYEIHKRGGLPESFSVIESI